MEKRKRLEQKNFFALRRGYRRVWHAGPSLRREARTMSRSSTQGDM